MKERPIIFSGPMVRAILEGRKTQDRRVVKPQPTKTDQHFGWQWWKSGSPGIGRGSVAISESLLAEAIAMCHFCHYGRPGDQLWVREAIELVEGQEPDDGTGDVLSRYVADGSLTAADAWPWKRRVLPAIFCPRGLSRITLEVTDVRVQRLQEISSDDCFAEGIDTEDDVYDEGEKYQSAGSPVVPEHYAFTTLWDSINAKRAPWASNPWVWAITFRELVA